MIPTPTHKSRRLDDELVGCVAAYYRAAAGEADGWRFALQRTADLVQATGTVLFGINTRLGHSTFGESR